MDIEIELNGHLEETEVVELYSASNWSSAHKPDKLIPALRQSDTLVTARVDEKLVGIGNAISDGHLVVYYPHLLVHPDFQGEGIGTRIMEALMAKYTDFHQQMLTADGQAAGFYRKMGFERAGNTEPMWIYAGNDHD